MQALKRFQKNKGCEVDNFRRCQSLNLPKIQYEARILKLVPRELYLLFSEALILQLLVEISIERTIKVPALSGEYEAYLRKRRRRAKKETFCRYDYENKD